MRIANIISILVPGLMLLTACRKSNNHSSGENKSGGNCVVTKSAANGRIIDGQYIIAYKQVTSSTSGARLASFTNTVLERNHIGARALLNTFSGSPAGFIARLTSSELNSLGNDTDIAVIEPDRLIAFGTCFEVVAPTLITWNVARVGYGDGTGKTAWIIDTGIDFNHPDLNVDSTRSRSFISGLLSAADENGHGTHVAGIIGAKNNSFGVLGVASGAHLISLRVFDKNGQGLLSSVVQALAYATANAQPGDVVNMSLGEDQVSAILDQQVTGTASRGIFITIAAGNDSKAASLFSPGRANGPNIYTVSAVDSLDNFAGFSNFGNDVIDYAAPGVQILSTYLNGQYAIFSGTSMAAPHVAGLLLLNGKKLNTSGTAHNDPDGVPDPIVHK